MRNPCDIYYLQDLANKVILSEILARSLQGKTFVSTVKHHCTNTYSRVMVIKETFEKDPKNSSFLGAINLFIHETPLCSRQFQTLK